MMASVELEWISKHPQELEKHSGKWVAVTKDGIISSSESLKEAREKAKEKIKEEPLMFKVPRKDEGQYIL